MVYLLIFYPRTHTIDRTFNHSETPRSGLTLAVVDLKKLSPWAKHHVYQSIDPPRPQIELRISWNLEIWNGPPTAGLNPI